MIDNGLLLVLQLVHTNLHHLGLLCSFYYHKNLACWVNLYKPLNTDPRTLSTQVISSSRCYVLSQGSIPKVYYVVSLLIMLNRSIIRKFPQRVKCYFCKLHKHSVSREFVFLFSLGWGLPIMLFTPTLCSDTNCSVLGGDHF